MMFKHPYFSERVYSMCVCGIHQGRETRGMVRVLLSKSRKKLGSWSRSVQVSTFRRFPMVGSRRNLGNQHNSASLRSPSTGHSFGSHESFNHLIKTESVFIHRSTF